MTENPMTLDDWRRTYAVVSPPKARMMSRNFYPMFDAVDYGAEEPTIYYGFRVSLSGCAGNGTPFPSEHARRRFVEEVWARYPGIPEQDAGFLAAVLTVQFEDEHAAEGWDLTIDEHLQDCGAIRGEGWDEWLEGLWNDATGDFGHDDLRNVAREKIKRWLGDDARVPFHARVTFNGVGGAWVDAVVYLERHEVPDELGP